MSSIEITKILGKPPEINVIKVDENKLEELMEFLECDYYSIEKHPKSATRYVNFHKYENQHSPLIRVDIDGYILVYPEIIGDDLYWDRSRVWPISEETLELFKRQQRETGTVDVKATA